MPGTFYLATMSKSKLKPSASAADRPRIGQSVVVRSPFFPKPTAGMVAGTYEEDTNDVIVQVFPVGREPLQIPAIPFFASEPDRSERSAVWPAL
jgi:hypothetical protein